MEQLVELVRLATLKGSLLVNLSLMEQIHGYLHHCSTCTLTVTCLQEPQLAFLYSELHILHIMVVMFELVLQSIEFCENLRHSLFH